MYSFNGFHNTVYARLPLTKMAVCVETAMSDSSLNFQPATTSFLAVPWYLRIHVRRFLLVGLIRSSGVDNDKNK